MSSLKWMGYALFGLSLMACELRWKKSDERNAPAPIASFRPDLPPKGSQFGVGGGPIALDAAIERITEARCQRENECGSGRGYASCTEGVRREYREALNPRDCPESLDPGALNACLTAERSSQCGGLSLSRVSICTAATMCRKPAN